MKNHVTNVDCKAGSHISSTDLSFTGAEGGTLLLLRFPCDGATRVEDDGVSHTAEFEEQEMNAFSDGIANL